MSGYSGAGTVSTTTPDGQPASFPKVSPESLSGGVRPYALTDHMHEREATHHLRRLQPAAANVAFVPVVGAWFRGLTTVANVHLENTGLAARDIRALYERMYAREPLIDLTKKDGPGLGDVQGRHGWVLGGIQVHSGGKRVVVAVRFSVIFDHCEWY